MVQDIFIRYQTDTSDLERAENILLDNAKAAEMSEEAVSDYNRQLQRSAREIAALRKETERLEKAISEATDDDEIQDLNDQLSVAIKRMKELGDETKKTGDGLEDSGKQSGGLLGALGRFGKFIGPVAAIGTAVAGIAKPAVEASARYEQLEVAFTTFLGSADAATEALERLNQFSLRTPFTPDQVQEAGKALLAFGEPVEELEGTLSRIGDIAAGTGKDFNELSIIYGKARIAGTLYAEDINQLVEAGVPIIDEFAQILGVTNAEVKQLASEGQISFGDLETAFGNLTSEGGKFFGLIDAQSQTLSGRISTLQGRFAALSKGLGDGLAPVVGSVVDFLNGLLSRINELDDDIDEFTSAFDPLVEAFESFLDILGAAGNDIDFVGAALDVLAFDIKLFGTLIDFAIVRPLTFAINAFNTIVRVGTAVGDTFRFIRDNISQLGNAIQNLSFSGITDFFNGIREAFGQSLDETALSSSLTRTLRNLEDSIDAIDINNFEAKGKEILDSISKGLEEGLIDEARAQSLSQRLADRIREVTKPVEEPIIAEPEIVVEPKLSDSEINKINKEKERIEREAEKLAADVLKLTIQIQIEAAGGNSTLEGLRLQEEEQIRQLESQAAFIELRKTNIEVANQAILNIQNEFSSKRIALIEKEAQAEAKAQSDGLKDAIDNLNRELLSREVQISSIQLLDINTLEQQFNQGLISLSQFQQGLTDIQTNAEDQRIQLALDALVKANEARKALILENEQEINILLLRAQQEALTEQEQARLNQLQQQNQAVKDQAVSADQAIADERVRINQEANQKIIEQEIAARELRTQQATEFLNTATQIASDLGSFFEAQEERKLAAAANNEEEQERIRERAARQQKALAISQALIGASLAVIRIFANETTIPEPFGTIQKVLSAAAVGAATLAQVAKIRAIGFAEGIREAAPSNRRKVKGKVSGKRGVDDIPAVMRGKYGERELVRIDEGERIISKDINKKFFDDLNAIEDGRFSPGSIANASKIKASEFDSMIKNQGPLIKPIAVPAMRLVPIDSTVKDVKTIDYKKLGKSVAEEMENKRWEKGSTFWREITTQEHTHTKLLNEILKAIKGNK